MWAYGQFLIKIELMYYPLQGYHSIPMMLLPCIIYDSRQGLYKAVTITLREHLCFNNTQGWKKLQSHIASSWAFANCFMESLFVIQIVSVSGGQIIFFTQKYAWKYIKNWVFNKYFTWLFDISGSQDCADPVLYGYDFGVNYKVDHCNTVKWDLTIEEHYDWKC